MAGCDPVLFRPFAALFCRTLRAPDVDASTACHSNLRTRTIITTWPHIELLAAGVILDDLKQHTPVGSRGVLGDAAAALQVEGVHLLADVIAQLQGGVLCVQKGNMSNGEGR